MPTPKIDVMSIFKFVTTREKARNEIKIIIENKPLSLP